MSREERSVIGTLKRRHCTIREIAHELRRSISTISDELNRNAVNETYASAKAHSKDRQRKWSLDYEAKRIPRHRKLQDLIEYELYDDQSPEAIAGFLKHRQKKLPYASKNTIYRYIESPYGRRIEYHRSKIKRRGRRKKPRTKPWKNRVFIDKRPKHINARLRIGHSEGDFIVSGKSGKGILLVVPDRKLRATFLEQILELSQRNVTRACLRIKGRYPEWKSMTTDNDILFQHHKELERKLGIKIYFCFPGHMWEKPSVENVNGYIRKYIPKGSDISRYSKRFIRKLEERLNRRIMKVLSFKRPQEMLDAYRKRKKRRSALGNQKK